MKVDKGKSTTTKHRTEGGDEGVFVANIFRKYGTSVAYVTSIVKPPRGTRSRRRARRSRSKGVGSVIFKGDGPTSRRVLLGSRSGLFIAEDGCVVTNFLVMEISL